MTHDAEGIIDYAEHILHIRRALGQLEEECAGRKFEEAEKRLEMVVVECRLAQAALRHMARTSAAARTNKTEGE